MKFFVLFLLLSVLGIYFIFFRSYIEVRKIFKTLRKFLDARDVLILKLIKEIKDKSFQEKIICLINERKNNFESSYNNAIRSDINLNSELKIFYDELSKKKNNELIIGVFNNLIIIEKNLKKIRNEYNVSVEKFNNCLMKHKFVMMRVIKMKPLDIYNLVK